MPKQAYICEICLTPFETEDAAANCESTHCPKDEVKFTGASWECSEWAPAEIILEVPIPMHPDKATQSILFVRTDQPR